MKVIKNTYNRVAQKAAELKALTLVAVAAPSVLLTSEASALERTDLTQDTSGGANFDSVATNLDGAAQTGASLLISFVTLGGFVVVGLSLYTLWKASKDEREKPLPAIVGLFIGGAMAAVGSIMWIMKNTIVPGA